MVLPDTLPGSRSSVTIQFQNTSTAPVTISNVNVTGAGFSITDAPFLPTTIQPQASNTVTVTYAPTAAGPAVGRLLIGTDVFLLSANGFGSVFQYSYQSGNSTVPVLTGGNILFTPIGVGQSETQQITITNAGNSTATIGSIAIQSTTGVFQLVNLPGLPAQLAPKASLTFNVAFSPQTIGQATTVLNIDGQTLNLVGNSSAPPALPTYHFTGASGVQQPFQQPAIGLSLDAPYPIALTGTLTLTVSPANIAVDPAVQFSSGGRQVTFTIAANSLQAVFPNGSTQIRLQTGTVAGTIQIIPSFQAGGSSGPNVTPTNVTGLQLTVQAAPPVILSVTIGSRTLTSFSVVVSGYATSRSVDHLTVNLVPASGFDLSAVSQTIDVSTASRLFFQGATAQSLGGQFTVDVPFNFAQNSPPPSGTDLTRSISAVSVTATNDLGTSATAKVTVP